MRALFFDVFGTLVDWRKGVARESRAALAPLGYDLDWLAFADAWRAQYQPTLESVRSSARAFVKLDVLHRESLQRVLPAFGVSGVNDATLDELTLAWHRLDAWPDVVEGLTRMREHFLLAPVSNGHISLMTALARRNGFVWDAILGAEHARNYKPRAEVYRSAADAFDLAPGDCMMVAAHTNDLVAAARLGLKTAHIARPSEHGPGKGERAPGAAVDHAAQSLIELAHKLV